jgi:hypothetical protein
VCGNIVLEVRLSSLNKLQRASYKLQGVLGKKKHHQVIYGPMKLGGTKLFRDHSLTTWSRRRGWGSVQSPQGGT